MGQAAQQWIGLFDLFRVGLGPSSSHTVGPMVAAASFAAGLAGLPVAWLRVELFGSLALTGKGHATDIAVMLGLTGAQPDTLDPDEGHLLVDGIRRRRRLSLPDGRGLPFDPAGDIVFLPREMLPRHPNALRLTAGLEGGAEMARVYYSIGGGFVLDEQGEAITASATAQNAVPHPFANAADLLAQAGAAGLSVAGLMQANEASQRSPAEVAAGIDRIWDAMRACTARGLRGEGELPGGLRVRRRAPALRRKLEEQSLRNEADPLLAMDWVNLWALAVNEENAAGGRVVTAPTNGAAGIIPAVLHYYERFVRGADAEGVRTFLLAAAAIGAIIKRNASISGAEVGCQGEVGSACAMAAAGLAAALGGSNAQVENAAEIGLEHNLGLTCDPVAGLVQVPCIERNAIAAVKAINAARLALHGDGTHLVSLDQVIATMRQTGLDMSHKYKETSLGGLAVNVVEC
ncbi:L-serine ammonia-lyase [Pseudoroseomonas ludipueritiae]|uniref:L-serine dehydratase n=1 Tax=Pseudoroseomonas ludipueritiae TaxID=198093 RepID=A0ABR7R1W5_9PROT|nr:L-serine ammonia-lyase [Pseudoroseomonas ludipueritiae]MBC9175732.1 L-serine ammonia-lyase [Pseudoroseomonas ludipueritiae]